PEGFRRALQARKVLDDALAGVSRAEVEHKKNRATATDAYGRYLFTLDADAETCLRFETALQAEMDAMRRSGDLDELHPDLHDDIAPLRFYAATRLIGRGLSGKGVNRSAGAVSEVGVLVDVDTMMYGLHERSVCELINGVQIDVEVARRLACEA